MFKEEAFFTEIYILYVLFSLIWAQNTIKFLIRHGGVEKRSKTRQFRTRWYVPNFTDNRIERQHQLIWTWVKNTIVCENIVQIFQQRPINTCQQS